MGGWKYVHQLSKLPVMLHIMSRLSCLRRNNLIIFFENINQDKSMSKIAKKTKNLHEFEKFNKSSLDKQTYLDYELTTEC